MVHEGVTSLIAHVIIGKMQATLKVETTGLPIVGKEAECPFSRSEGDSKFCDRAQEGLVPCCTSSI